MTYIPGICNITPGGRRKRLAAGIVFAVVSITSYLYAPTFLTVILVFITCVLLIEYVQSFCVYKGLWGMHEDENGVHHTNRRFAGADRKKSWKIIIMATIITAIVTAAASFL
ncbi:MAG: hypothetical protein HYT73_02335 [Candidatus Aenigmarchaeota archaeon]|nr:hypothetical protein [Candidatus Aenigmarchaeota archaeon]